MEIGGIKTLLEFRPTWRKRFTNSLFYARGISPFEIIGHMLHGYPRCYICGRQQDFVFNFVPLIHYFDMSLSQIVHVCQDHGRVTDYDCATGEPVELPLPKPYWQRRLRDWIHRLILGAAIPIRFAWFFLYDIFMWYIAVWFYYWHRQCKKS